MSIIRKHYGCGCCVGISVFSNRLRGIGILKIGPSCPDVQDHLDTTKFEVSQYGSASKYLALTRTPVILPKKEPTELFSFHETS
jgi:hypothetical protein